MVQLIKILVNLVQKPDQSNEGLWDVLVQQGGNLPHRPGLIEAEALTIAADNGCAVPNENGTAKATDRISNKIKVCFS
jgi:hypothetical protein